MWVGFYFLGVCGGFEILSAKEEEEEKNSRALGVFSPHSSPGLVKRCDETVLHYAS